MVVFLLALSTYHVFYGPFFFSPKVGSDYSLFLPQLLEGYYWILNNGIGTPFWFSPGLCGGIPVLADPQNLHYALPQGLTLFLEPIAAVYATVLIFASIGYWGMFLFLSRTMGLSGGWAITGALLFMFNGFFSARMMIGHLSFHGMMLLPALAGIMFQPMESRRGMGRISTEILLAVGMGLILAAWVHGGMVNLILPAGLTLVGLFGLCLIQGASPQPLIPRWLLGGAMGAGLSATKIVAGLAFLSHFPRSDYALPVFPSLGGQIVSLARSLFLQPGSPTENYYPHLINIRWDIDIHEWSFGITLVPMLLVLIWSGSHLWALRPGHACGASQDEANPGPRLMGWGWGLAVLALLLPLGLNWGIPSWQAFLKEVPILKSSSSLIRWWMTDMVMFLVISLMLAHHTPILKRYSGWGILVAALFIGMHYYAMDRDYYARQTYASGPTSEAWQLARHTGAPPRIHRIGAIKVHGQYVLGIDRNNLLIHGVSSLLCYNPIFGYRLEYFPMFPLRMDRVDAVEGNLLNFKNPACYLYPEENQCLPGDHFTTAQKRELDALTSYHPFEFKPSSRQSLANRVSETMVGLTALLGVLALIGWWRSRPTRRASP